jgi:hypothetical protein
MALDTKFTLRHAERWAREVYGMEEDDARSFAEWYVREYGEEEDHLLPAYSTAVRSYYL